MIFKFYTLTHFTYVHILNIVTLHFYLLLVKQILNKILIINNNNICQ